MTGIQAPPSEWLRSPRRAGVVLSLVLMLTGAVVSSYAALAAAERADDTERLEAVPQSGEAVATLEAPAAADTGASSELAPSSSDDSSAVLPLPVAERLSLPDAATSDDAQPAGAASTPVPAATAPATAPAARVDASQMRLRIPAFRVDAPVTRMGVEGNGRMEIPSTASLVAWYGFTAAPGQPGNAVFAAHVNYAGQAGAFFDLHRLEIDDEIAVHVGDQVLRYRVTAAYLVRPEEADMAAIIGSRSGKETITLITCGGEFDRSIRAYDRRVIVRAERI